MSLKTRLLTTAVSLILAAGASQGALADGPKPMAATDGKGSCPTIFGGGTTEWYVCDNQITGNGLPAGGSCAEGAAGSGATISDAANPLEGDAFDLGGMLWVNNIQVGGLLTVAGQAATYASQSVAGLTASLRYDVLTTQPTTRVLLTLTNPGSSTISVPVDYATNFGSDGSTLIRASSSGDTSFTTADRWLITSETLSDSDPVNTTVLWGGTPQVLPQSVSSTVFTCAGSEGATARFPVSVAPGASISLMFFQRIDETTPNAVAASSSFDSVVDGSPLLAGMTPAQFASVVNWNLGTPPAQAQSVPIGQGWTLLGLGLMLGLVGAVAVVRRQG